MKIENIFSKDINRAINGVIKADQSDKAYNELEEYVITKEVDRHLRQFVDAFLLGIDHKKDADVSAKMGVWVSGFFGSGKSHFIKILSYLLNNQTVSEEGKEAKTPLDFFLEKVSGDAVLQGDLKRLANAHTEVILFNIDSKAEQNHSRDAILQVFLKVFNEHVGYCGDHPEVAHMERFLDDKGKYQEFIDTLANDHDLDWKAERDSYQFYATEVGDALSKILNQQISDPQAFIDNLEKGLSLSIENFAKWVQQYLDKQGSDQRLVFLVDEVGQFIGGQTQLMLNLQTITEELGTKCQGRAWVVVTSQEDIEAVVGAGGFGKDNSKDFSKIQGRFTTRLSLSGSNADEVIQRRLLSKTDDATQKLKSLFHDKGDILRNQITFRDTGITLRPFTDTDNFIDCYPFPPYQFLLVQKIFEASRQFGATGGHLSKGERSMLDAFQTAALAIKDKPLGALVPLDSFYPSIESFLEGVVRTAISRVDNIVDRSPFDSRVLKTLFLIRYVEEVPANIDNLITFFVDEVDADKRALRSHIEESLLRLERDTLISRNGDLYFFLTNEERDINKEIKDQDYSQTDLHRLLGEIIFEEVLKDRRYRFDGNGKDFDLSRLIDLAPIGNRSEGSLTISVLTPLAPDFAAFNDPRCIEMSVEGSGQLVIKLRDDQKLADEITTYIQTQNYLRLKTDGSLPLTTKRIHDDKRQENTQRRNRIHATLSGMLEEAKFFVLGSEKSFTGGPKAAVDSGLRYLVENSYNKLSYIQHSPTDPMAEIRRVLADPSGEELDLLGGSQNAKALKDVLEYIDLLSGRSQSVNLGSLINERFARHPYGWKEHDTLLLVCRLFKSGQIELQANGGKLQASDIFAQIDGSTKWNRVSLSRRKTVDKADIQSVRNTARDLFGVAAPEGEDGLHAWLRTKFDERSLHLGNWSALATTGNYPGSDDIADIQGILNKLLANKDSYAFLEYVKAHGDDLTDAGDRYQRLETFYTQQRPQWDALRSAYNDEFEPNAFFLARDAQAATALATVRTILSDPKPYGRIKESAPLIAKLRSANDGVIAERRAEALAKVDPQVETIKQDLAQIGVDAEFSNQCLKPIQDIRKRIETETQSGKLTNLVTEADDEAEIAHAAIEKAVEAAKQAAAAPAPAPDPLKPTPAKVAKPENFKPRRQITARSVTAKQYLETAQDVEDYLSALRKQLEEAIASNARIEIL